MASLSGQNIKDTFQKLVQVDDGGRLQNGIGGDLGQVTVTGSIAASSGFTGSLQGNADTSTLATLATTATSASFATTASLARIATSASVAVTASFVVTASYSTTSDNTTLFAGKNIEQFITTGSVDVSQTITGSLRVTQNLDVLGTASFQYVTASQTVVDQNTIVVYASGSILPTAGLVVEDTSSAYSGSSFLYNVVDEIWTLDRPLSASLQGTSSYALTASNLSALATASYALTASYTISSSNALTASYLDMYATASYALTASYLSGSINVDTGSLLITASLSGSMLEFTKGDGTTFTLDLPAGSSASGSSRVFEFTSSATQWDMTHNFDQQHVSVTLYDSNHLQIGASQISASDANNVSVYFTYPVAGYAMVLAAGSTTTVSGSNIETGSFATTGSNTFTNNQYVTGSVDITGSLFLNGVSLAPGTVASASFASTASYIETASYALTASYWSGSIASSSYALTASYIETVNYAATASYLSGSIESASFATTASHALTASYVESASYALITDAVRTLNQTVNISGSVSLTGNVNNVPITTGKDDINGNFAIGTTLPNIDATGGGDNGQYNIAIGEASLSSNTSGNYNTAINRALVSNMTGVWNTAVGYNTMFFGSNVSRNVTLGMWTLTGIDNSSDNVAVGTDAGRYITSGNLTNASASIFIGDLTRARANNSVNEVVIGARAVGNGNNTTTIGNLNTVTTILRGNVSASSFTGNFTGSIQGTATTASLALTASFLLGSIASASYAATASYATTALNFSGSAINNVPISRGGTDYGENIAIGESALTSNSASAPATQGVWNTAIGYYAAAGNISGWANTTIGSNAAFGLLGSQNTAIGFQTLFFGNSTDRTTAIGSRAFNYLGNGGASANNVALGTDAGRWITTNTVSHGQAQSSIFIGYNTKPTANNQSNQIVIGTDIAGNGSNTTTIGTTATTHTYLRGIVTASLFTGSFSGSLNNLSLGRGANDIATNVAVGTNTLSRNSSGARNVAVGDSALTTHVAGADNTAIGSEALRQCGSGSSNTGIGSRAMYWLSSNTNNTNNTAIGKDALFNLGQLGASFVSQYNTALGATAGQLLANGAGSLTQSDLSVFIGYGTKPNGNNQTNQIVIGANAHGSGSNTVVIGNSAITNTYLSGIVSATAFTGSFNANGTSDTGSGLFLTSPNGTRYKLTVDNSGALTTVLA